MPVVEPELVPVFVSGADLPQPRAPALVLPDDLLSEALFGEVIDISELIPRLLSPLQDKAALPATEAMTAQEVGLTDGADITAAHAATALTILYDEEILATVL